MAIAAVVLFGRPRPLAVVEVVPAGGATGVPRGAQVVANFSRPLDESSARSGFRVEPDTPGFVSVAGRRAAFTPRVGFRGDTDYTVILGPGVRGRSGRGMAAGVSTRFHTEPLTLVLRTVDGRLLRGRLGGVWRRGAGHGDAWSVDAGTFLTEPGAGAFAVSAAGALAYVRPDQGVLVVEAAGPGSPPGSPRRLTLPPGLVVRDLEWAPRGDALVLLGAEGQGVGVPYLARLSEPTPVVRPFGPRPGAVDPNAGLVTEALTKSLVEIVYRRESFAFTPDGRAAIVRDQNWDLAVVGFDGERRGSLGPFLAVGNTIARGDLVAVVDVNPADPALRRRVLGYRADGRGTLTLSSPDVDSHSPVFAPGSERAVFATGPAVGLPGVRRYALEVVDVGTGVRRRLSDPPAGRTDGAPRWSPDEAWIAFLRAPIGAPERAEVWVVSTDGGLARPLSPPARDARWGP